MTPSDQLYQLVSMCSLWGTETTRPKTETTPLNFNQLLNSLSNIQVALWHILTALYLAFSYAVIAFQNLIRSFMLSFLITTYCTRAQQNEKDITFENIVSLSSLHQALLFSKNNCTNIITKMTRFSKKEITRKWILLSENMI